MATKISIIIVSWNTAKITLKCVQTIKKYLSTLDPSIIVVDNASTDNTIKLLSKEHITIIKSPTNLGYATACNLGANHSKSKYLLFLNSDMEFIDDSLSHMLKFLSKNPRIGLIGPQFLNPDLSVQASVFPPQSIINAIKEFWFGQPAYSKYTPTSSLPSSVFAVSGGAVLISTKFFNKIGGWNNQYFMYY